MPDKATSKGSAGEAESVISSIVVPVNVRERPEGSTKTATDDSLLAHPWEPLDASTNEHDDRVDDLIDREIPGVDHNRVVSRTQRGGLPGRVGFVSGGEFSSDI